MSEIPINAEGWALAQKFHEVYERLAPSFGYATRAESAKPWGDVPLRNKQLMAATCTEILKGGVEEAHEGTTADKSVALAESSLSQKKGESNGLSESTDSNSHPVSGGSFPSSNDALSSPPPTNEENGDGI